MASNNSGLPAIQAPEILQDPHLPVVYVDGVPIPTGAKPVSADIMTTIIHKSLLKIDEATGKTKLEAGTDKLADQFAMGLPSAQAEILNRTIGRPMQTIQSVNVTGDVKDFLRMAGQAEGMIREEAHIVEHTTEDTPF